MKDSRACNNEAVQDEQSTNKTRNTRMMAPAHSLTHSPTHSVTHSLTHSLTHATHSTSIAGTVRNTGMVELVLLDYRYVISYAVLFVVSKIGP